MALNLLSYLAVFSIYLDAFNYFTYVRIPLVILIFVLLLLTIKTRTLPFNKTFLLLFCLSGLITVFNVFQGNASFFRFILQTVGILSSSMAFYFLIRANNNDTKKIFRIYMQVTFFIALIGIFQQLSFLANFTPGYHYGYLHPDLFPHIARAGLLRIDTIVLEPTDLAFILMPAFFASVISFTRSGHAFISRWQAIIIVIIFFFTFSSTGYIGILFTMLLIMINYRKFKYLVAILLIASVFAFVAYNYIADVQLRVNSILRIARGEIALGNLREGSSFSLLSNAAVSFMSFRDSPIFGYGLGSYETIYPRYINKVVGSGTLKAKMVYSEYQVNYNDAGSLFFRLLSETGIVGIIAFFIFIGKFYLTKDKDASNYLWIINNAVLCIFLVRMIRGGHYFYGGFFLFFWLYYFSKIEADWLSKRREPNK